MGSDELNQATNTKNQTLKCQPRCEHQNVIPTITSSVFPVEETFPQHPFFCLTLSKIAKICTNHLKAKIFEAGKYQAGIKCQDILNANNTMKFCSDKGEANVEVIESNPTITNYIIKYAMKNLAVLKIYIKHPYYTLIIRDEQSTLLSFLGNTGGLLGLCMGLSLVSIFEILYHFLNYIFMKCQILTNCVVLKK
jgi:hypothetical protein